MKQRHARDSYYVVGEGELTYDAEGRAVTLHPSTREELRKFRFSRLGDPGKPIDPEINKILASAMIGLAANAEPDSGASTQNVNDAAAGIPAGFTYLAQFVDHDLTRDVTPVALGQDVNVDNLVDGRSPALDLDSVYGRGPGNPDDRRFYAADGIKLKTGTTAKVGVDPGTNQDLDGFDLPRVGSGPSKAAQRAPLIPDDRNDENLAIAQTHVAFIHFHNRVVDTLATVGIPSTLLFDRAKAEVVCHYQWMLRTDLLPQIVDPSIVDDVFTNGRRYFEVPDSHAESWEGGGSVEPRDATMPIEFSVAAYRLGHSMIRDTYQWNRLFNATNPRHAATLFQLFTFTGTSGILTPAKSLAELDDPNGGTFLRLPTIWIVDWRRLYNFAEFGPDFLAPADSGGFNVTKRIDTLIANPLGDLPAGTFLGGRSQGLPIDDIQRNLAFRDLTRANMVRLASGQQMAEFLHATPLTADQILAGDGQPGTGVDLSALSPEQKDALVARTPLWFYVLREAEINGGKLGQVGGRIVVEVFHRAMEASTYSVIRDPYWRPTLGSRPGTFKMVDLLLFAFDVNLDGDPKKEVDKLNPLGNSAPT